MSIAISFLLGLIQGLTEFLPVSSSGHLILAQYLMDMPEDMMLFNIMLHVATLCAVLIVFRYRVWELIRNPFSSMGISLMIATLVTVTFVLVFGRIIDAAFSVYTLPVAFFITAIVLLLVSFIKTGEKEVGHKEGAWIGLVQGLAVIPGFSRSGFTIAAGLTAGVKRERAAEFSFLMSIPIIVAALVYEIAREGFSGVGVEAFPLMVGFLTALVSGIFAIKVMLALIKRIKLYWFSVYLIILAVVSAIIIY